METPTAVVVAIDGPAGSGKSTLARRLAGRLGWRFLDSGAMYRSLTLKALRRGVDVDDGPALAALLAASDIRLVEDPAGQRALLDGEDVSAAIRSPEVNGAVSAVAARPEVRDAMKPRQRAFAREGGDVVVEGRDMGTVVFPEARVKVYLDALPEVRARRRALQTGESEGSVRASLDARDASDSGRAVAPLRAAADAVIVDTTPLDADEVLDALLAIVRGKVPGVAL